MVGTGRWRNQAGRFTRVRPEITSVDEYVEESAHGAGALKKFLVPASESKSALADLDAMGITHSRVYPELTGCALAARIRVMLSRKMF